MQVIRDGILLCDECVMIAVNGDASGLDYSYAPEEVARMLVKIEEGLTALGPRLVPDFDSESGKGIRELTNRPCACCGTHLAGRRHEFAVLGS